MSRSHRHIASTHSAKRAVGLWEPMESIGGAESYRFLENGLTAIVYPKHDIPVVATMVTYCIGSVNEHLGTTGSTHILEHMMFKGSQRFDAKDHRGVSDLIESKGATVNATTWYDRTNYYEVAPRALVRTCVELEADRMRNLTLRKEDLDAEMVVVRNEYERGRNDPHRLLSTELWATAFTKHPYHYDTIGIKEDIEQVTVEKLQRYYNTFYWPQNATVSLVGDIRVRDGLELIGNSFSGINRGDIEEPRIEVEPEQHEERRISLSRSGTVQLLSVGYKVPGGRNSDSAALLIASGMLANGKGSRLYRELVDANLATSVSSFSSRFRYEGLSEFTVSLARGVRHESVLTVFDHAVSEFTRGRFTDSEFRRSLALSKANILSSHASLSGFAGALNESIALGDWTDVFRFTSALDSVTPQDVQRVLNAYYTNTRRTVGKLIAQ